MPDGAAAAPGNTLLSKRHTRLPRDSVANASQIATLEKADLVTLVGALPAHVMKDVEEGIRWFLRLEG